MLNKKKTYWNTCIKFVISANQSCRWWSRKQCCRGFRLSMPSPLLDSTQTTLSQDAFSVTFQAYRLNQLTYFLLFVKNLIIITPKENQHDFFFFFAKHICLMMHLEFYFKSWARVLFFSHVFCGDLSLKSCFDLWRPFLLSLLRYLLVFCALQKCKCVCISVNVYFVEVHEIFIL